jgi:nucleotide-binding universal stress UspA family protein
MRTAGAPARRILVGIDGSPASAAALRWAAKEAAFRGLALHVVYVQDRAVPQAALYAPSQNRNCYDPQLSPESTLQTALHAALGSDLPPAWLLEAAEGLPARVLLDRATDAEMLVLGSIRPSPTGTRQAAGPRATLGPVARDCLRGASCPVVVVRPGSDDYAGPVGP